MSWKCIHNLNITLRYAPLQSSASTMPTPTEHHKTTSHRDVYVRSHQSCHTHIVFSIFSAHLCAGFDMKTQRCGVTIKGDRGSSEKKHDGLWSPPRQRGKTWKMQIALTHIQMRLCKPQKQMRPESWNKFPIQYAGQLTLLLRWHPQYDTRTSVILTAFGVQKWLFSGVCVDGSRISRTKIAGPAEKNCSLCPVNHHRTGLLIRCWNHVWCVCVRVCVSVCVSLYSCAYTGPVH